MAEPKARAPIVDAILAKIIDPKTGELLRENCQLTTDAELADFCTYAEAYAEANFNLTLVLTVRRRPETSPTNRRYLFMYPHGALRFFRDSTPKPPAEPLASQPFIVATMLETGELRFGGYDHGRSIENAILSTPMTDSTTGEVLMEKGRQLTIDALKHLFATGADPEPFFIRNRDLEFDDLLAKFEEEEDGQGT